MSPTLLPQGEIRFREKDLMELNGSITSTRNMCGFISALHCGTVFKIPDSYNCTVSLRYWYCISVTKVVGVLADTTVLQYNCT